MRHTGERELCHCLQQRRGGGEYQGRGFENDCAIIRSPLDTFTVARLINQSIPVKHIMKKDNPITFQTDDFTDDIKDVMVKNRHRAFPVVNKHGKYIGTVSRRNLLGMKKKEPILASQ